jgi:hypothetical protein
MPPQRTLSRITQQPGKKSSTGITSTPPTRPVPPNVPRRQPVGGIVILLVAIAGGVGAGLVARNHFTQNELAPVPQGPAFEEPLLGRFVKLHNAGDPDAAVLLGPQPRVPDRALSPVEAEKLQTEFFLRQKTEIKEYSRKRFTSGRWRTLPEGQFVLVVKGHLAAPPMKVRTDKGVKTSQAMLYNPDLIVEVREGTIHGVRAELHEGP